MATRDIIAAGFGGQGIMAMGQLITYSGMLENKFVSWLPSYGPEMRGGSANCSVVVSDEPVGSPVISQATDVIVMNEPSLEKFEEFVAPGGNLFLNSSLIKSFTNDGITVLISSHILSEVDQVVDKVGILVSGKLAYEGENNKGSDHLENLFMDISYKGVRREEFFI